MPKVEFGDFYKFLVSVGIVLIAISFIFPWLVVQESYDPIISTSEFQELPIQLQELLTYRNSVALWIFHHLVCIVIPLFTLGLIFLTLGSCLWIKRQKIRDEDENIEHRNKIKNLGNATPTQKAYEITEDISFNDSAEGENINKFVNNYRQYLSIERNLVEEIRRRTVGTYEVFQDKKIKNKIIDAILVANSLQHIDILVEIKYLRTLSENILYNAIFQVKEYLRLYHDEVGESAAGLIFIVISKEYQLNADLEEKWKSFILSDLMDIQGKIFIELIQEEKIYNFEYFDLLCHIQSDFIHNS